jgi:DNA-binding beta-propeller fold protein YncE
VNPLRNIRVGMIPYASALLTLSVAACSVQPRILIEGLDVPMGIAVCDRNIFVAEAGDRRVGVYDSDGRFVYGIDGFERPFDVACSHDFIFVADFGTDRVFRLRRDAKVRKVSEAHLLPLPFAGPAAVTVFNEQLYVTEFYGHRVQKVDLVTYQKQVYGHKGSEPGAMYYPTDTKIFSDGRLVVADAYNHRVQIFDADGSHRFTFTREDYGFNVPASVAVNADLALVVADSANHRVVKIGKDRAKEILWQTDATDIHSPARISLDHDGLYIVDPSGGQILIIENPDL